MFARVINVQVDPGDIDKTISIYGDDVIPALKQQEGFEGALLLGDRKTGKGVSITMWASEENLNAGEQSGFTQKQIAKFSQLLKGTPTIEGLEILLKV
jgi:heme-degrading monooxygenase HmoA